MNTEQTMEEILPRIEHAIQRVLRAVSALPPRLRHEPLLAGERSVKDVLGHLTWWDQWLLLTLPPAIGESRIDIRLPLADQIPPTDKWAEEMNAKVQAFNKLREYSELWDEMKVTCEQLVQRVSHMTRQDLYDPDGMSSQIGQPVAPLILGIYEHYEEHAEEFERLLV